MDPKDEIQDDLPIDDQTADLFPDDQDIDPDNPDGTLPDDAPEGEPESEADADAVEITIEGFEDGEDPLQTTETVKFSELRKLYRETQRELKTLKRAQMAVAKQEEAITLGEKPTLAAFGFDDEKYEAAFVEWTQRKAKFDQQEQEKRAQLEREQRESQEVLARYDAQKRAIRVPPDAFKDAEANLEATFNQTQIGLMSRLPENLAEMVYAIGSNEKALSHLAGIKDPAKFVWELRGVADRMKKTEKTKSSIPAPERVVRGGAGGRSPALTSGNLEKLREDGLRRGDLTEYYRARERAQSKA